MEGARGDRRGEDGPGLQALLEGVGTGHFGAGLDLREPHRAYGGSVETMLRTDYELRKAPALMLGIDLDLPVYPDPGGYVVVASMDRQSFLLGPRRGILVDLVWLDADYDTYTRLECTLSKFILDLYEGRRKDRRSKGFRTSMGWGGGSFKKPFFTQRVP